MVTYDFKCKDCSHEFTTTVEKMGDYASCIDCGGETTRIFLAPPHYKKKIASRQEKGIKKDLIEISHLEEARDASRNKYEKFEMNREIQKIESTPVKGS